MMLKNEQFITVTEAIQMMPIGVKIDRYLLYRERKKGRLPSFKFGGKVYFKKSDVENYIKQAAETE